MAVSTYNLQNFIQMVDDWGLTDVMLPFLIVFVVIFAVLQKTKILGDERKNLNVILSLAVALTFVIPHVTKSYPMGYDVVDIMNKALPTVSLVAIAVIFMLILIGLFGGEAKWAGGSLSGIIAIISFVLIIIIFGGAAGWWGGWGWFNDFFGHDAVAIVIIVLVFALIITWVTSGDKATSEASGLKRGFNEIGKFFGGGGGH